MKRVQITSFLIGIAVAVVIYFIWFHNPEKEKIQDYKNEIQKQKDVIEDAEKMDEKLYRQIDSLNRVIREEKVNFQNNNHGHSKQSKKIDRRIDIYTNANDIRKDSIIRAIIRKYN